MCDNSVWGGRAGDACATAACGTDVQALHVTMHASDGESAWDKKKTATGRPDTSYTSDVRALVIPFINTQRGSINMYEIPLCVI